MTNARRNICSVVVALGFTQFTVGCGSSSDVPGASGIGASGASGGGSAGKVAQAGASTTGTVVGDGKAFVPEDVEYSLVDEGNALTLLAATVIDNRDAHSYWVVSVRNDERDPICSPRVNAVFTSATDTGLGDGKSIVEVQGVMSHSDFGEQLCLAPGEVGMGWGRVDWDPPATKTVKIDYQPGGDLIPGATARPSLSIADVKLAASSAGNVVTGTVTNSAASSVEAPIEVTIFPLDSAGRPIDFGYARSTESLASGSSWTFSTTIPSPINKYVAFVASGQARY